ncbi:helix-turn-helix domain-containing protein [Mucilaginibacter sp. SP1R1]|uniref:AraC family transcriptional regulator n=1 Tax=Mucilaginibacter sp. SP1R1 TaxID=2723091 RepID=UPI003B003A9B
MEQHLPASILKPFIKAFLLIESVHEIQNETLPDTSIVMAFRYRGTITDEIQGVKSILPNTLISGLRKSARIINYSAQTAALLVIFKPGGATAFFKEPFHELFGASLSLDTLVSVSALNEITEQLAEARSGLQRVAVIERFLISRLHAAARPDLLVYDAIRQIQMTKGAVPIKKLLTTLPVSRDPFEKRFRRLTGTSPKQFSSIVRLRHMIDTYIPANSLTAAALTAGYFDQAHFIKDFKLFTGKAPLEFFKSPLYW